MLSWDEPIFWQEEQDMLSWVEPIFWLEEQDMLSWVEPIFWQDDPLRWKDKMTMIVIMTMLMIISGQESYSSFSHIYFHHIGS